MLAEMRHEHVQIEETILVLERLARGGSKRRWAATGLPEPIKDPGVKCEGLTMILHYRMRQTAEWHSQNGSEIYRQACRKEKHISSK